MYRHNVICLICRSVDFLLEFNTPTPNRCGTISLCTVFTINTNFNSFLNLIHLQFFVTCFQYSCNCLTRAMFNNYFFSHTWMSLKKRVFFIILRNFELRHFWLLRMNWALRLIWDWSNCCCAKFSQWWHIFVCMRELFVSRSRTSFLMILFGCFICIPVYQWRNMFFDQQ